MPNRLMAWNKLNSVGNPTRCKELNDLIRYVRKKEARRQGAVSHTRRSVTQPRTFFTCGLHKLRAVGEGPVRASINCEFKLIIPDPKEAESNPKKENRFFWSGSSADPRPPPFFSMNWIIESVRIHHGCYNKIVCGVGHLCCSKECSRPLNLLDADVTPCFWLEQCAPDRPDIQKIEKLSSTLRLDPATSTRIEDQNCNLNSFKMKSCLNDFHWKKRQWWSILARVE